MATVRVQRLAAPWALKGEAGARAHVLGELVDKRLQFARAQRGIPGSDMQIELRGNLAGGGRWRAAKQAAETSGNPRRILERGDRVRVTAARPSPDSQYLFVSDNGRKEWDNEGRGHHWTLETPKLKRVTKRHNPKVGI